MKRKWVPLVKLLLWQNKHTFSEKLWKFNLTKTRCNKDNIILYQCQSYCPIQGVNPNSTIHYLYMALLTSIWCMTVRTNQQYTRKSIIFQHYLMNDSTTRLPEANTIFCRSCGQEVVNFFIDILGFFQVCFSSHLSLYQVITVDGCRNRNL